MVEEVQGGRAMPSNSSNCGFEITNDTSFKGGSMMVLVSRMPLTKVIHEHL